MPETTEQTEQAEKGWLQNKYSQEEVGYTDYAVRRNPVNSVCQTCRWFINRDFSMDGASNCHIVECYPLDIVGTGYCNQWTARKIVEPEPMAVVLVEESDDMDSEELEVGTMARYGVDVAPPVVDTLPRRNMLKRLFGADEDTSFKVLDDLWIAFFTNNIEDKDEEILEGAAHKDYVARVKTKLIEPPELWRGHIDGTAHGKALYVDYVDDDGVVTVFAIGEFDPSPEGQAAKRFYQKAKPGDISLSHGFLYPRWAKEDGHYKVYNTFEITTLIPGQEANEWTNLVTKGKHMPLSEAQRKDIENMFGDRAPEIMKRVEQHGSANKAIADGLKAKYKGVDNFTDVSGDSTANKATDTTSIEGLKALIPPLFEDAAAQLQIVEAMDKKLDTTAADAAAAKKAVEAVGTFDARLKALETLLEMQPTAASESDKTVIAETAKLTPEQLAALPTEVKAMLESLDAKQSGNAEFDPFFGDLKVKKAR